MERELVLPNDFHEHAWEIEAKGVFWNASVLIAGKAIAVTFYDPVRLSQEVADELSTHSSVALQRVLVVPSVTEKHMRAAVGNAPTVFFQ